MAEPRARSRNEPTEPTILVTGATGFIGGQLLVRLAEQRSEPIVCIVRADDPDHAARRGRETLEVVAPSDHPVHHRVRWLRGDLEEQRMGLASGTWGRLAASTVEIFHCAASTRFDLPLADAHRANVTSTEQVLALAAVAANQPTFRRLHHISTAYAAGKTPGPVSPHHLPPDRERHFRNSYERTKARAERLLRAQSDVPVTIYRPSIVAGATADGRTTNWNVLYGPMKMIVKGNLPVLGAGGEALLDVVGVDYVVDALVALSAPSASPMQAFHLTAGPSVITVYDFVDRANEAATDVQEASGCRVVGPLAWRMLGVGLAAGSLAPRRMGRVRVRSRLGRRALRSFEPYAPYTGVRTSFVANEEHRFLRRRGVVMPPGLTYLDTVIRYAVDHRFGAVAPSPPDRPVAALPDGGDGPPVRFERSGVVT